jgi:ornithine--oxo-acid transaminase
MVSRLHTSHKTDRPVEIVGVAMGAGARDDRCRAVPDVLNAMGMLDRLRKSTTRRVAWRDTLRADDEGRNAVGIVCGVCARLAEHTRSIVAEGRIPIVVGGDHSSAIGTWTGVGRALRERGALGLIWIDAHLDAHTPETSRSGALHGMPLACLLGHGEPDLIELVGDRRLAPEHLCVIGVRSFEAEEARLLQSLGVRIFFMDEVLRRGLPAVMRDASAIVAKGTAGFGVSLDLDAIDPADAPGVGTPVQGGLAGYEVVNALAALYDRPGLCAVEIAEYNPARDHDRTTAQLIEGLMEAVITGTAAHPPFIDLEQRYGSHHYAPLPIVLAKGEGAYLWDENGRRYLDMLSAYSAVSCGHAHPRLVAALTEQSRRLAVTSRGFYNDRLPLFLKRLCEITGLDLALPANTGLEAVEAALKVARKWGHAVKGIAADRAEIVACEGNFHGRSIAEISMSSEAQYREGFGPLPAGFVRIPYGDVQALEGAITARTAAFIVEPIQGEGGIIVPPEGYLAACAEVCRRHRVLLICDEVQTGLGRTGRLFACEHESVKPDGLILGKALGGGLLPVSAFVGRREVMEVLRPGDHGSTFGGNPLAAAVGLAAIDLIVEEELPQRAAVLGRYFIDELRAIDSPVIREVRGRGLMIGVELHPAWASAQAVCLKLMQRGVLSKEAHGTVLRFAPPLIVTREEIDFALAALRTVLAEFESGRRRAA